MKARKQNKRVTMRESNINPVTDAPSRPQIVRRNRRRDDRIYRPEYSDWTDEGDGICEVELPAGRIGRRIATVQIDPGIESAGDRKAIMEMILHAPLMWRLLRDALPTIEATVALDGTDRWWKWLKDATCTLAWIAGRKPYEYRSADPDEDLFARLMMEAGFMLQPQSRGEAESALTRPSLPAQDRAAA